MTQPMLVVIAIVCLVVGPLVQRMWDRWDRRRLRPEPFKQLEKMAEALSTWLNEGQRKKLLRAEVSSDEIRYTFIDDNPDNLNVWLNNAEKWLRLVPFVTLKKDEALAKDERQRLERWFRAVLIWLFVLGAVAALVIAYELRQETVNRLVVCFWGGLFGGCVAAFRSCLDRRAHGFEDKHGNVSPESEVRKERFNDGMARWFIGRPILSAGVGLLLYFAVVGDVFPGLTEEISKPEGRLVFYACLAGLLAKTLLDLFLEAGKKIFRVEHE